MSNNITWVSTNTAESSSPFSFHSPRPDGLHAVKVAKQNLKRLGDFFLSEGFTVTLGESAVVISGSHFLETSFKVGDWIIQSYDYETGENSYELATLDTRKNYDLR